MTRRPRRRPSALASTLPTLVLVALLTTGGGSLAAAGDPAPVVDLQVTSVQQVSR